MKKILLTILTAISISGYAQQSAKNLNINLQQAKEIGLKNRFDVQANKYNLVIADDKIAKSKAEWIPDLSGGANVRYSSQIQSTFIPAGSFSPQDGLVTLGARNMSVYGLDLNQTIFKPGINLDIKIARNNLELAKEKNKQDENYIKDQISQAYLNVLLKELQSQIAAADEQRYKEYAEVAEGKLKLGTLIENDYLKAKLDHENAKVETLKARQNYELAVNNLKHQINVPDETKVILADSLNSPNLSIDQLITKGEAGDRTEIKQLIIQQQGDKLELNKVRQNALPSLSFYANYSQQFSYTNFNYTLSQWWTPFSYLGLRLSIPITGNFKNAHNIKESRIKSLQSDLTLEQKKTDINFEIKKTGTELSNAMQNMRTTKNNYELSRVVYENQKKQYNLGTLLYSNLLDTDKSLNTTEQIYIKAVYDFLLANINYQKAIGNY